MLFKQPIVFLGVLVVAAPKTFLSMGKTDEYTFRRKDSLDFFEYLGHHFWWLRPRQYGIYHRFFNDEVKRTIFETRHIPCVHADVLDAGSAPLR